MGGCGVNGRGGLPRPYYLGYVGKWQVDQERDPTQFGFEDYVSNDGYKAWRKAQGSDRRRGRTASGAR